MKLLKGIILGFLVAPVLSFAYVSPGLPAQAGTPSGLVNDYASLLSAESHTTLESELLALEKETGIQIAVVTIPDLSGDTIENYAVKLFEEWGIGQKGKDNGALLLISRDDRQLRIEVGYGLEGALTDALSSQIIRNIIAPNFKNGDYNTGIVEGVRAMLAATRGEYTAEPETSSGNLQMDTGLLFFFAFVVLRALTFFLARSPSWWMGGVLGGLVGGVVGLFAGFLYTGLIALIVFIPIGLIFDFLVSRSYKKHKSAGGVMPWWFGGPSPKGGNHWGSGHGWGGGGGFGGGRSGGGGSSGGW